MDMSKLRKAELSVYNIASDRPFRAIVTYDDDCDWAVLECDGFSTTIPAAFARDIIKGWKS